MYKVLCKCLVVLSPSASLMQLQYQYRLWFLLLWTSELRKEEKETDIIVPATGEIKQLAKYALLYMHTDNIWVDGHTVPVSKYLSVCKENLSLYCPVLQTIILVNSTGFLI